MVINDRWSQLSMKQRADLIKLYTDSGITSLNKIREDYNTFDDGGNTHPVEVQQGLQNGTIQAVKKEDGTYAYIRQEKPVEDLTQSISEYISGPAEIAEINALKEDIKAGNYGTAALMGGIALIPGNWRKALEFVEDLGVKRQLKQKGLGRLIDFSDSKMPIKEGGESVVYIGEDKVFKVPRNSSPEMTLDEITDFNRKYAEKRNIPPHTEPLIVEGVTKGASKGKYYPVYSQRKLNVVGDETMPIWEWEKHKALLDAKMRESGWPDIGGSYYYNKELDLHVGDISPMNTAYDDAGNILIIDGDVYACGGKIPTKRK